MLKIITGLFFFAYGLQYLTVYSSYAQQSKSVRVAIVQDAASLRLKIRGSYEIIDPRNQKVLSRGRKLNTTVIAEKGDIALGKIESRSPKVLIKASDPDAVLIDGRNFRGEIQLIKKGERLLAVNNIDLEDYIKGILYHESSHYWPPEALKAQAVASRTYAVYQMQENAANDYDVTSDIYSQVYGGQFSERYRTNRAVEETKGEALIYQGRPFPAYFHATCGGHTEDASLLWNIDIPPLKGVPCGFCKDSPHFNWHLVLSLEEIAEKFSSSGKKIKNIKDIVILGRDKSGRMTNLEIIAKEKELKISAKDFRNTIGPNILRSTNFDLKIVEQDAVFTGLGWGHGVGMCQWGAYFMAKQGKNYREILEYYYPQSNVKTF